MFAQGQPQHLPIRIVHGEELLRLTATIPSAMGLFVDCVVLLIAFMVWIDQKSRPTLRRQSLQMILITQLVDVINNIFYLTSFNFTAPTPLCPPFVAISTASDIFNHFVIMLIAVNLQLIVVHGISTKGFVPYYLGGAFVVTIAIAIPPAIRDVWGWDDFRHSCFMKSTNSGDRVKWNLFALDFWLILAVAVSLVCTTCVLFKLFCMRIYVRKAFGSSISSSSNRMQASRLISIAWRIVLYPIILIIMNSVGVPTTLYLTYKGGVLSRRDIILCVNVASYAAGHLGIAFVAIFVDPSLSSVARRMLFGKAKDQPSNDSHAVAYFQREVEVELSPLPGLHPVPDAEAGAEDVMAKLDTAYFPGPGSADKSIPFQLPIYPGRKRGATIHVTNPVQIATGTLPDAWAMRRERLSTQAVRPQHPPCLEEL